MKFLDMKKIDMFLRNGVIHVGQPIALDAGMALAGVGRVFWLDGANGSDVNDGQSPHRAVKTLTRALALMTADQNDILFWIGGDTSVADTAQIVWSKDYCHIFGIASPTPNARCKHTASGCTANQAGFKVTAKGCVFTNIRFWQSTNVATVGAVEVAASQNFFFNCDFLGQVTANPAGGANAYSLFLNGAAECRFVNCQIGTDTYKRTDGAPLKLDGSSARNEFIECRFSSYCETAAKPMVKFVDTAALDRYLLFKNCWFYNFYENHGAKLNECFTIPASCHTHDIIIDRCTAVGITEWASGDRGSIWVTGGAPAAGSTGVGSSGIAVQPT